MATVQAVLGNLTARHRRILTAVNTGASTFSFVGSGFIVLCYLLFKELRKFSFNPYQNLLGPELELIRGNRPNTALNLPCKVVVNAVFDVLHLEIALSAY